MKQPMDKRKVIAAYRRGFISIQECAQIIGVDSGQMTRLINDPMLTKDGKAQRVKRSVNS
jgi:predicted transcriptional regulator of viral defense system